MMPFVGTETTLLSTLFNAPEIAAEFADAQFIRYLLQVEAALAAAQAKLGIIPAEAAQQIVASASRLQVDLERLHAAEERDGIPIPELVKQLRQQVGGDAASFVHWGATSQDVMDTALVLQCRAALHTLETGLVRLIAGLARLADRHRHTLMVGRTHSQQALPIPFGLKVAGWIAPLLRHQQRLAEIKPRVVVVQLGGAVGTLAALDQRGSEVQAALAAELKLGISLMSWHTQRDGLAELAGWLSLLTGSLAKMAQDIILMAQTEVGELRETDDSSRGGSSTMPQKSNPILSELIIAAARTNASLLAAMHQALVQEHERATHGWQVEWLTLPQMFILSGAALNRAVFLSEQVVVDSARMHENVRAANGLILAESLSFALTPLIGRAEAQALIKKACAAAVQENRHLVDVVHGLTDAPLTAPLTWETLKDEAAYFGAAETLIDRVLQAAKNNTNNTNNGDVHE